MTPVMNKVKLAVGIGLAIWFGIVLVLGAAGTFDTPHLALPLHLLIGVLTPVAAFLVLYRAIGSFRAFVLTADLRLVIGVQAWRFAGFGFLALYAHHLLPGLFALPAGLGDMAIGLTAPWIVLALTRRPEFAASNGFVFWHFIGLVDLVVALTTGILGSGSAIGIGGEITTDVMGQLPLVLIPCYFVPIFIMLHVTALFQARHLAQR